MSSTHFHQDDRVAVKTDVWGLIKRMWPHFMRHRVLFFTTLAAVLGVALASRLSVTLFGFAIDHGLAKGNRRVILFSAAAYFVLEGARCYMTYLHGYLFSKIGNRILFEIREQLLGHVQHLPIAFFDKNPTGRIVTRVTNDVVSLGDVFTQGLIAMFSSVISLLAIAGAMALISVKLTLLTLIVTPFLVFVVSRLSRRILEVLRSSRAKIAAINAFVAENISGMRLLQVYGRIGRNTARFQALTADYRSKQLESVRLYAMLWPVVGFFNAASVGAALYFGGHLVLGGGAQAITTGAMVAFILHVRAFIDPLNTILEKYQILQNSLSGAERIFTLLDETRETDQTEAAIERLRGDIAFENVGFRYTDGLPFALAGVNLTVRSGQSVALVGRTGSGKSTMIALLQRFYDPTEGRLLIDGVSITDLPRGRLRSRIGVVQQDTFLFRGTVAENISLGDPRVSRERVEHAARLACLEDVIMARPGGLDARVEERGANLSVGERQLIAFARILAFDPDILILDEATANIDSRTESLIQEATRRVRQGRTSFIIAHRISTVLDCDQIVVLDQARVQETGTHAELLAKDGLYAALCKAQNRKRLIVPTPAP